MNTKALYAAIAVIALLIIGLFVYNQSQNNTNELSNQEQLNNTNTEEAVNTNTNTSANTNNTNANANTEGRMSGEEDIAGKTYQITYDGLKFSPATLTVNAGDTVVFKNQSSKSFWPASGPHPTHTLYPEFDAGKAIAASGNYAFTFTKVGTWPFHDHLNSSVTGSIIVK